jgi:hypothetical protein
MTIERMDASSSGSTLPSSAIEDIRRLIAPSDRPGFDEMLQNALRGRELPNDEVRRIAVTTWHQFCHYGWPRDT